MSFTKNEYNALFVGAFFSLICTLVANYNETITSILAIVFIILSMFYDEITPLYLVALSIPNTRALEFFGVSGAIGVCTLYVLRYVFVNNGKIRFSKNIVMLCTLYLLYSLQFFIRFNDIGLAFVMPIKGLFVILFFDIISKKEIISKKPHELVYKATLFWFFGICIAIASSIIVRGKTNRLSVLQNDPNMLSVEIVFVLSVFIVYYFEYKFIKTPQFSLLLISLSLLCFMCGSRNGLILLAGLLVFSLVLNFFKTSKVLILFIVFIMGSAVFLSTETGQQVFNHLLFRTNVLVSNDNFSNGRFEIWEEYISLFKENQFLLLIGLGSYTYYGIEYVAHNFLLEDLTGFGLIGILLLYSSYLTIFSKTNMFIKSNSATKQVKIFTIIPFLIPILGGITLHGLTNIPNSMMMYLGCIVWSMTWYQKSNE